MTPFQTFDDVRDMLRRRAWLILSVLLIGSSVSLGLAAMQQHLYRSSEVLQIEQPKIADDLARSTVDGSSARRLQLIEQQLMARATVLEIIEKHGLFSDVGDRSASNLIGLLRTAVRIEGVAAAREGFSDDGTISTLTITAEMPTAAQAQIVAHEISQRTVELSHRARVEQAKETLTFVARQEGALALELETLETEVAAYRAENNVALASSIELRAGEIAALNEGLLDIARERIEVQRSMELVQTNERPATAERLQAGFEERLATLDAQRDLLMTRKIEIELLLRTTPEVESRLEGFDRQMDQIRDQLIEMRRRRTEAEIGFRLETARQSERLTVLEPAPLPDHPFTGSRKKLAAMGIIASMLAALVLVVFLEIRDPVLRTAQQMEQETGLKPVVTIPEVGGTMTGRGFRGVFRRS